MNSETRIHKLLNRLIRLDPAEGKRKKAAFQKITTSEQGLSKAVSIRRFKTELRTTLTSTTSGPAHTKVVAPK
jgi:hypothetical protein